MFLSGSRTQMTATTTASTLNNLSHATTAAQVGSGSPASIEKSKDGVVLETGSTEFVLPPQPQTGNGTNHYPASKQLNGGWFDVQLKTISHKVQQQDEELQLTHSQTPVPSKTVSSKR